MSRLPENKYLFSYGSITELFRFQVSAIILMDYDEGQTQRLLSLGYFSINIILHVTCPILATFCSVDGFHWPLTKDTVVIRMAKRTFALALPGLLYGLQFPQLCPEVAIDALVKVFKNFSHYKDINDTGLGYPVEDNEPNMWNKLRPWIEPLAHETLMGLGQLPGCSRFSISNKNSCYLRACRMSATTKLIIESINARTLTTTLINFKGINPPDAHQGRAYASVSAFSSLVDAVELSCIVSSGLGNMLKGVEPPRRAFFPDIGFRLWSLNEEGLLAFLLLLGPITEQEEKSMNEKDEKWKAQDKEKAEASARANDKGKQIIDN